MSNLNLIETLTKLSTPHLASIASRESTEFSLNKIKIKNNKILLDDSELTGYAFKKIINQLNLKKGFINNERKMTPDEWDDLSSAIKNIDSSVKLFATKYQEGNTNEVIDVHTFNPNKKHPDDATINQYFQWITESLEKTEKEYSLKEFNFSKRNDLFEIILKNESEEIDVFGTNVDIWKPGDRFYFNGFRFNHAPFFERLICSNGNIATEFGYSSDISRSTFNNKKIFNIIENSLVNEKTYELQLQSAAQHLKNNNISLLEFYEFRNFFDNKNSDGDYDTLLSKYFKDQIFYEEYGNVESKSRKWKSTANSGINAYDFFNMLTWIGSHESSLNNDHRIDLQIKASNILFKPEFDLEDVAVNKNISYPILSSMN